MTDDKVVTIHNEPIPVSATDDDREEIHPAIATLLAENAKGFDILLADFRRDCKPINSAEDALVQMMARHFWGALRKTRTETGIVESHMERSYETAQIQRFAKVNDITDPGVNFEFDTRRLGVGFDLDCGRNNAQLTISRAAAASDTAFLKYYSMLQKVQSRRPPASPRKLDRAA